MEIAGWQKASMSQFLRIWRKSNIRGYSPTTSTLALKTPSVEQKNGNQSDFDLAYSQSLEKFWKRFSCVPWCIKYEKYFRPVLREVDFNHWVSLNQISTHVIEASVEKGEQWNFLVLERKNSLNPEIYIFDLSLLNRNITHVLLSAVDV